MADTPKPNTNDTAGAADAIAELAHVRRRSRTLQVVSGVLIVVAIALLVHALLTPATPSAATPGRTSSGAGPTATAAPTDPLVGHLAPDVTVHDMRDHLTALSSLRGSVVLLNFWYVSCPPCQIEMPALERAYLAHQSQGFKVVGLDVVDDASTISAFTSRLGITYPILRDIGQRAVLAYQVRATPSSYLIDRGGVIRAVYIGPINSSTFQRDLAALLA
ncbi:MAG TPA: TlpA disulfide reductase family protein [Ktedonobacterales bacterium]|nr:TlpA disulfide reductase family protein [Ktedonobacterales bacterium]